MRKISLFMNVTLDGYFENLEHDISWAKGDFEAFSPEESQANDTILLGRKTYELMEMFWPTPQAQELAPEVAKFMNDTHKVAASHQNFEPKWQNTTVFSGDNVTEQVKQLKEHPGGNIIILGSNNLSVSLMQAGLIDVFQIVVNPVVLGAGSSLFEGFPQQADLKLMETRQFNSGAVLLSYQPK
jgi:dihydrofolate reductase